MQLRFGIGLRQAFVHDPKLGVFGERVERSEDTEDQPRRAVEEAAADDVAIEESQRGAEE